MTRTYFIVAVGKHKKHRASTEEGSPFVTLTCSGRNLRRERVAVMDPTSEVTCAYCATRKEGSS